MTNDQVVNKLYLLQAGSPQTPFFTRKQILAEFEGPASMYSLKRCLANLESHRKVISDGSGGYRLHNDFVNPPKKHTTIGEPTQATHEVAASGLMMNLEDSTKRLLSVRGKTKAHVALVRAKRDLFLVFEKTVEEVMLRDSEAWSYFLHRLSGWRVQLGVDKA